MSNSGSSAGNIDASTYLFHQQIKMNAQQHNDISYWWFWHEKYMICVSGIPKQLTFLEIASASREAD